MQPPKSDLCVICGKQPATTRDHVPPKSFFLGLRIDRITVPACRGCNNSASSDDEDMRFFLSMQVGKQAPGTSSLWEDGAFKSLRRKKSLQQLVASTLHEISGAEHKSGADSRHAVVVPSQLYSSVFGRVTRGLYFHHTASILDFAVPVNVVPLVYAPGNTALSPLERRGIGDGAFSYWYGIAGDDPTSSLWVYCFYGSHWIQATTGRAGDV